MGEELKGIKKIQSANTPANAVSFLVESYVNGRVNTMTPVIVLSVNDTGHAGAAGRVSVRPLVCQRDAEGNALDMAECFELPYMRYQGGVVAVVCDPQPGDIGIAVYSQTDSSNVQPGTAAPVQPGSFRTFSESDGWYIGGFLNQPPTTWIEMLQDNTIKLYAPQSITLETPNMIYVKAGNSINVEAGNDVTIDAGNNVTVNAGSNISLNAPVIDINGSSNVNINTPQLTVNAGFGGRCTYMDVEIEQYAHWWVREEDFAVKAPIINTEAHIEHVGDMHSSADIIADTISLQRHHHIAPPAGDPV